jgi:UDP-N-acetylmuramate dehydrogenase
LPANLPAFFIMQIIENLSLKNYNTFGIDTKTRYFTEFSCQKEIPALLNHIDSLKLSYMILSGGSNFLFTQDFPGLIVHVNLKGITKLSESGDFVLVKAMAGEDWEGFVKYCLKNNWGGIENLTLIPGKVGTSPMQNIGAYGVELKDVFHELEALKVSTGEIHTFKKSDCRFGYRNSFFKQEGKGQFIILSVTFRLTQKNHIINTRYGTINYELEQRKIENPDIHDIAGIVRSVRTSKLPDPEVLGNAGSFFKNPVIPFEQYEELKKKYPEIIAYPDKSGYMKVAAGWLIENAGWKGHRVGDAGVHKQQALVLVNHGKASGREILQLSENIRKSVADRFQITLEPEVNIL